MNIAWIEQQIETVSGFLAEDEGKLREQPDSFALRLVVRNKRQHLDTLHHELMVAQAERDREVMELRLLSPALERGAIPLRLLGKLAEPLHKFIAATAYRLRHGQDAARGIPAAWANQLDLRLARLSHGSTRMILTGNVHPDMAGDSALQEGLDAAFRLLNSGPAEFFDALHAMGPAAARGLGEFLHEMERENIAAEFGWIGPDNQARRWDGRLDEIVRLRATLEDADQHALVSMETLSGSITLLAATGRIEIVPDGEMRKIRVTYPKGDQTMVAGVTLHERVTITVEKTSWPDPASGETISRYQLAAPIHPPPD